MRISDWSSDVCSSDLLAQDLDLAHAPIGAQHCHVARAPAVLDMDVDAVAEFLRAGDDRSEARAREIGRASCRERVCQYVYISVVAVSLKKKHIATLRETCIRQHKYK